MEENGVNIYLMLKNQGQYNCVEFLGKWIFQINNFDRYGEKYLRAFLKIFL